MLCTLIIKHFPNFLNGNPWLKGLWFKPWFSQFFFIIIINNEKGKSFAINFKQWNKKEKENQEQKNSFISFLLYILSIIVSFFCANSAVARKILKTHQSRRKLSQLLKPTYDKVYLVGKYIIYFCVILNVAFSSRH